MEGRKGLLHSDRGQDQSTYVEVAVEKSQQLTWRLYIRSENSPTNHNKQARHSIGDDSVFHRLHPDNPRLSCVSPVHAVLTKSLMVATRGLQAENAHSLTVSLDDPVSLLGYLLDSDTAITQV